MSVHVEFGDEADADRAMPEVFESHRKLGATIVARLHLTAEHISRTDWMAASLLSRKPDLA